ncbi:MAG: divalent metal cation transporter, partial [Proteobacteria bacterium]
MKRPSWLPSLATAPFCPSEASGSVIIPPGLSNARKLALFLGPGLMVAVGYMDPGNWATDLEAGSRYGYGLLFVILLSSLTGMLLQTLSMRVGLISGLTLAELSRDRYSKPTNFVLWIFAEIAIIATDVAEVLGSALAFKLLLGVSLQWGIAITA